MMIMTIVSAAGRGKWPVWRTRSGHLFSVQFGSRFGELASQPASIIEANDRALSVSASKLFVATSS